MPKAVRILSQVFMTSLICWAGTAEAQTSDTTPPQLVDLTISPAAIDVTASAQSVTVALHVTDDLSGLGVNPTSPRRIQVSLRSPSGGQFQSGFVPSQASVVLDAVVSAVVSIPRFSEPGAWALTVFLADNAGNTTTISTAALIAKGLPSSVSVVDATPDVTAPQLSVISLSPSLVDVSGGDVPITVDLTLQDDLSGVLLSRFSTLSDFVLTSPSGKQSRMIAEPSFQLISGNSTSGVWRATLTQPRFSEAGVWTMTSVTLRDAAANVRVYSASQLAAFGASAQLGVTSAPADTMPPQLLAFDFQPTLIDTSAGPRTVRVNLSITDDLSGVSFFPDTPFISSSFGANFVSPSGLQRVFTDFSFSGTPPAAGSTLNGIWQLTATFPQFSEAGTWHMQLSNNQLKDAVRNLASYSPAALAALGFPTTLEVIRPSLVPDATVGAAGGVASDTTFGARAQVVFPAGALSAPTTIAIDVLQTPSAVPTPTGFSDGTLFTNVSLSPTPSMPFAAPGLTVTLPFSVFRAPGTLIHLYRIDPATGLLVPATSITGGRVAGRVNADGLSATFMGVAHLSTLVGFFPTGEPGDVDGNGVVDCADMAIVKASFGKRSGQLGFDPRADLNGNGVVDVNDLAVVSRLLPPGTACR